MGSLEPFFEQLQSGVFPSVEESMRYEGLRLASFHKRPRRYTSSAVKLVSAGFYYAGKDDIVACFKCGVQIGEWEAMDPYIDPLAVHADRSPDCPFLNNVGRENVPYGTPITNQASKARSEQIKPLSMDAPANRTLNSQTSIETDAPLVPVTRENNSQNDTSTDRTPVSTAAANNSTHNFGGPFGSSAPTSNFPFGNSRLNFNDFGGLFGQGAPPAMFDSGLVPPFFANELERRPNFLEEKARLETFTLWPGTATLRPSELAKAGFYYLGAEDRVQCAFCKGVLRNWDPTDDALVEHKKHFPTCPFIKDPKGVGNVPDDTDMNGINLRRQLDESQNEEYMLGIMTERAYHPHLAMKIERLNTFVHFYSDSSRNAEEFAEAGFFFTGQGDNVKCFFCDGGLRNWERNDDPWLEHARWFPKCGYLRTKKGEEYVKDIRKRFAPPGTRKPKLRKLKARFRVDEAQVTRIMRSEMIEDVSDMGFSAGQIKEVVERRLRELGTEFPTVESLVDMLYEQEALKDEEAEWTSEETDSEGDSVTDRADSPAVNGRTDEAKSDDKSSSNGESKSKKKNKNKKKKKNKSEGVKDQVNPIDFMSEEKGDKLKDEVQKMKDERMCKVCMDTDVNIVFLKCGHLVCCSDCAPALRHCPICRQVIRGTIRVFLS